MAAAPPNPTPGWAFLYYADIFNTKPKDILFFPLFRLGNDWEFERGDRTVFDDPENPPGKGDVGYVLYGDRGRTYVEFEEPMTYGEYLARRREIRRVKIEPSRKVKKNINQWTRRRARAKKYQLPTVAEVNAANEVERRSRRRRSRRTRRAS